MSNSSSRQAKAGVVATALSFALWGFVAIYYKQLSHVEPIVVMAHRIVWTFVLAAIVLSFRGKWGDIFTAIRRPREMANLAVAGLCLSANWYAFVWAIDNDRLLDASLGYYINPLISIFLGAVFLRERLRPLQVVAILLAIVGVANLLVSHGSVPWAALVLGFSFATYGLLRKTSSLGSVQGLTVESAIITVPAILLLVYLAKDNRCAMAGGDMTTAALLVGTGIVTGGPLMIFSYGARRIRLATVGFLQYLAPSLMLIIGLAVYHEPFDIRKGITFAMIWAALAIYSWDSIRAHRQMMRTEAGVP